MFIFHRVSKAKARSSMACTIELRKTGKAAPRTCEECGLGPCPKYSDPDAPEWKPNESAEEIRRKVAVKLHAERVEIEAKLSEYYAGRPEVITAEEAVELRGELRGLLRALVLVTGQSPS